MPAVGAAQRSFDLGRVGPEVLFGDESAAALHFGDDQIGDRPAVKRVGPLLGDLAQRAGEFLLDEAIAGRPSRFPAVFAVNAAEFRERRRLSNQAIECPRQIAVQGQAAFGDLDCRLDDFLP